MPAKATRLSFGEALEELGEKNRDVVVLDADLSKSTMSIKFAKKFPDRFFEMGISKAKHDGDSSGTCVAGKIPFACRFACFLIGRYETIRVSVAYTNANVKLVGTHAGIGIGEDGYSQMGLEDIALMRALPNVAVVQPADDIETKQAVEYIASHQGPVFLRLTRQPLEEVNSPNYKFEFGKGVVLKDGKDVTIFATGGVVFNSLLAAEELEKEGISARVVNIHTIKPIDEELIIKCAMETGKIITVEDHSVIGGLGSAVMEVLSENYPVKVKRIGMRKFGESGSPKELYEKYGLDSKGIAKAVREFLK
ncbi:MAG: transketolase family protein [Candidatus Kryptonium sp.]